MYAAAIASANILLREKLPENAMKVGQFFLKGLLGLTEESRVFGGGKLKEK